MTWSTSVRRLVGVTAALTLAGALAACGGSSNGGSGGDSGGSAAPTEKTPQHLTIGLPLQATTLTPIYLANAEKIWAKHNLDVEILTFNGDAELVKAVVSGDVDVAVASLTGALNLEQAGQDISVFYGGFDMPAFAWYATKDIKSVEDAKGATWGVSTLGSSTDFLTRYAVSTEGLDPDKDIKIIQGGGSGPRLAAMDAGQIQVNILTPPFNVLAEEKGYNKILDLKDLVDTYPNHVSYSVTSYLDEHEDIVKDYVDALSESMQLVKDDPDAAAAALAADNKITVEQASASIETWIDNLYPDGRMPSKEGMKAFWDMGIDGGMFTEVAPEKTWLDDRFIADAS
jgi:NitT/TauT family transport system substrate-binding protein